jgi:hypothetical protein
MRRSLLKIVDRALTELLCDFDKHKRRLAILG